MFLENMDWELLREQKETLLALGNGEGSEITGKESAAIYGIIHLIDDMQDYAVDKMGMHENRVFGFK